MADVSIDQFYHAACKILHPLRIGSIIGKRFILQNVEIVHGVSYTFFDRREQTVLAVGLSFAGEQMLPYHCTTGLLNIFILNDYVIDREGQTFLLELAKIIDRNTAATPFALLRELSTKTTDRCEKILSRLGQLELLSIVKDIKPALRHEADPRDRELLQKLFQANNVHIAFSDKNISYKNGLTEFGVTSKSGPSQQTLYGAKSQKALHDLLKLEHNLWESSGARRASLNRAMGEALGYPPCCVDNFQRVEALPTPNIYFEIFRNTAHSPSHLLNVIDHNVKIVSHIPCSFDCEMSISHSRKVLRAMRCVSGRFLKGTYIYFANGCFIRLVLKETDTPDLYLCTIVNASEGEWGGSFADEKSYERLLNDIKTGDALKVGNKLEIYAGNQKIGEATGQGRDWLLIDFK